MWPFKRKAGRTKTPRYVHKAQAVPGLPSRSKAKRNLYKVITALIKSDDFYREQLEQVRAGKQVHDNKDHQKFLIDYVREQRKLLDVIEACVMLVLSDSGHVALSHPLRAYTERVLDEYLSEK